MTSLKQSITWAAVLLYHRLKLPARTNHRYRLDSSIFCTGVIHKLAFYFNNSTKYISAIVGVNGKNTKSIYKRALIDSRFYEIEFYLCKKADSRIFNCTTNTPVVTSQLQSPATFSAFDNRRHNVVLVIPPNIETRMAINNNTSITSESDKNSILPTIPVAGTTIDKNQWSSSQSPSIISAVNNHRRSIVSVTPSYIYTRIAMNDNTSTSTIQD